MCGVCLIADLKRSVPGYFGADGCSRHTRVKGICLLSHSDVSRGEDSFEFLLVYLWFSDRVNVDFCNVDALCEDLFDELDGCVHGLGVEVVGPGGLEHAGGYVASGHDSGGPAALLVEIGGGCAEGLHEV